MCASVRACESARARHAKCQMPHTPSWRPLSGDTNTLRRQEGVQRYGGIWPPRSSPRQVFPRPPHTPPWKPLSGDTNTLRRQGGLERYNGIWPPRSGPRQVFPRPPHTPPWKTDTGTNTGTEANNDTDVDRGNSIDNCTGTLH